MRLIETKPDVHFREIKNENIQLIKIFIEDVDSPKEWSMCRKILHRRYHNYDISEKSVCRSTTGAGPAEVTATVITDKELVSDLSSDYCYNYDERTGFKPIIIYLTTIKMIIMMTTPEVNLDGPIMMTESEAEIVTAMVAIEMKMSEMIFQTEMVDQTETVTMTVDPEAMVEKTIMSPDVTAKTTNTVIKDNMTKVTTMMDMTTTINKIGLTKIQDPLVDADIAVTVEDAELTAAKAIPMIQELDNVIHYVSKYYNNYRLIYDTVISRCYLNFKIIESIINSILVVKSKYIWDDHSKHEIIHPRQFRNADPCLHYTLIIRDGEEDTTRDQYNNKDCWSDSKVYDEIFIVGIQPVAKNKLCNWLETAGCRPNTVTLRKKDSNQHVEAKELDHKEIIDSIHFTDIIESFAFQFQNITRLKYTDERFLYLKLEFMNYIFCQTRKRIKDQVSVVLPNLQRHSGDFEQRMKLVLENFQGGAGDKGKAKVVAPARLSFAVEKDDVRQEHLSTYNEETGESDVIKNAKKSHQFNYVDCPSSDIMATSCYLKENVKYGITTSQQAKYQYLSNENHWARDDFRGEIFCFTKNGQPFLLTKPMKPIKHICKHGRYGCPSNCRLKNTFDWNAIPDWAAAFFMGEVDSKYKYSDKKEHAKLFRTFKRAFIKNVMQIPDADEDEAPKADAEKPANVKAAKSPTSLKAIMEATTPASEPTKIKPTGTGVSTPANSTQIDEFAVKVAKLQRENEEKEAKYQALQTEVESLKTSIADGQKNISEQNAKVDNLNANFVKHTQDTDRKIAENKAEADAAIDKTRVGLMNAVDRVGSHSKLTEQRMEYYETKNQVRAGIMMDPESITGVYEKDDQLQELGFVKKEDMPKAAKNLVEQNKIITKNKSNYSSGKSLVTFEQCAIAADASFGHSLQSGGRSQVVETETPSEETKYETVNDSQSFKKIFGFFDGLRGEIRDVIVDTLKRSPGAPVVPPPEAKKPGPSGATGSDPTITPPMSQSAMVSSNHYNNKSVVDSVDLFLQANSTASGESIEEANSTTSEKAQKRPRAPEATSVDITDLSRHIEKKFRVNEGDSKANEELLSNNEEPMDIHSPEYRTADEISNSETSLLASPDNTVMAPALSSSPKNDSVENPRAEVDDFAETNPDVFASGSREVGGAHQVKPPTLPTKMGNSVEIQVAQVHNITVKEYEEPPSEKSPLAIALDLPLDGCKRKVWTHSKELKLESPKHYDQNTCDRWSSRWIQYCVPHQFQQLCASMVKTAEKDLDSLDGLDRILYLEAKDQLVNISYLFKHEIPRSIFTGLINPQCEDPTMCWKLMDLFKPFPISLSMIEKFNQHILAQLDKDTEKYALQVLNVNMDLVAKKIAIPMFKNDNKASSILFRNFVLEWAVTDVVPVEKKKIERQQSIQKFTTPTKGGSGQPSPNSTTGVINSLYNYSQTEYYSIIKLISIFSPNDLKLFKSSILSAHSSTVPVLSNVSHCSPLGKVRMNSEELNPIEKYLPAEDLNQEYPTEYLSQEISPKKTSKLNPNAPAFIPNIWKKDPYVISHHDNVSITSAASDENDSQYHYLSLSSHSKDSLPNIVSKGTYGSCPYGKGCILLSDDHLIDYYHPDSPFFEPQDLPWCDLGIQCPYISDPEHTVRYKHPEIHAAMNSTDNSDLSEDFIQPKLNITAANTREGRILQQRYATKNMLYPGVNCQDVFMLQDARDRPEYNQKLRKEVLELNKDRILDPMVPIDDTLMPKKFETRKLFELRVKATHERRNYIKNRDKGYYDQSLYDSSNPTLRIKEKLVQAKLKKAQAKEKRRNNARKRKDFRDLTIFYTNLNDPLRQISNVFYWYGKSDIIVLTELDVDIQFFHQIGRFSTHFDVYTHKGDKFVNSDGTTVYKVYAAILINKRCNFDVKVKYNKIPFISLYITLPSKNDHPLSFNITAFYKFHCGPKSRNLRLHSKQQVDDFFINRFFDIHKIQMKVPSILLGDGNCDLYNPRKQDSKYFAREIRSRFGDYQNEIGKKATNQPNKRSLNYPVQNSCIDWFLTKNFPVSKIKFDPGRQMVDNDGHECITCVFDVPVLEQARLKTITVNHYPDKDVIFNHCFKVFQEHEDELERLFDTENLLRNQAKHNPDWEPPPYAGSYSARVYELLNQVANETILEEQKTVDIYRQRSAVSPFARETFIQLSEVNNQITQHRILPASSGILQMELETVLKRFRQRDQRKVDTGKEDWEHLRENDIFKLHQKFSSNMKLVRDQSHTFGCDKIGHNFISLQEQEEIPDIDVELWDDAANKFDPSEYDLKIEGKDRSDSITHIIAGLKLKTTSTGTKLCRKFLAGVPRNLIGHHLIRSIRLDTELGVYNQDGKTNKLIKLAKAGKDLTKLDGYRCIQVPKVCAQIGDCFLIQNFTKSLIQNNRISDAQNGFRPHYSCATANARIFDAINHNNKRKSILVFIDFRNAFGCVNHKLLVKQIAKVASKGVTRLIKDQLTGRLIVVHEDGSTSEPFPIPNVGVPQGSNGGPIFYSIYAEIILSFLLKYKDVVTILFADDTCLRICGDSYHEALSKAEEILQQMAEACNRIGLEINPGKSEFLLLGKPKEDLFLKYTVNGQEFKISQKNSVRYLGFHFDTYLAYTEHFGKIMQRLYNYRPMICRMIKVGNFRENRRFARQLLYGLLQYGMEVIPLGSDKDYGNLNLAIISAACDILNIRRSTENKKIAHSSIFNLFRWLESSNIHKLAILRFTNRVLIENRPADIAARLRSVLVYESDQKPFVAIDSVSSLSKDYVIAERRLLKADVPVLKPDPQCLPEYPHLYPYNLNRVFEDLPYQVRSHLGSKTFFYKIKSHFEMLCQHARYLKRDTCKYCRRRDAMVNYYSSMVQPINIKQPGQFHGIFSYHFKINTNPTWAHVLYSWQKVIRKESDRLNRKLRSLNFIKSVKLRPSIY